MAEQLHWEDVQEGTEITPLAKNASTQQLVRWAGASGDFYQIHYDKDFALSNNLPGQIIHGALKSAWLGQLLGDWVGEKGIIKNYGCSYRGMDVPDDALACKGAVTKKYVEGGEHLVACDIWLENSKGEKTTPGTAVVALPSKG
ncbi:MAG: MaoC/PaaZ C-terminal domain-containing protein [Dehalococcoidales bacterium]